MQFLLNVADLINKVFPEKLNKREKQLTQDNVRASSQACKDMVELPRHLLNISHKYICLGQFGCDLIQKIFGKLHQHSGGTRFINAQHVLNKITIKKAKLSLDCHMEIDNLSHVFSGHSCEKSGYLLIDKESLISFKIFQILKKNYPRKSKRITITWIT